MRFLLFYLITSTIITGFIYMYIYVWVKAYLTNTDNEKIEKPHRSFIKYGKFNKPRVFIVSIIAGFFFVILISAFLLDKFVYNIVKFITSDEE